MTSLWMRLWTDESGYLVSAELALLGTVAGVGLVAGLSSAQDAMNQELDNVAGAMRSLDQSFGLRGFKSHGRDGRLKSWTGSSFYFDEEHKEKNAEFVETFSTEEGRYVEINRCEKPAVQASGVPTLVPPREVVPQSVEVLHPPAPAPGITLPQVVAPRLEAAPQAQWPIAGPPIVRHESHIPSHPHAAASGLPNSGAQLPHNFCPPVCPPASTSPHWGPGYSLIKGYRPTEITNNLPLNPLASPAGPVGLVW